MMTVAPVGMSFARFSKRGEGIEEEGLWSNKSGKMRKEGREREREREEGEHTHTHTHTHIYILLFQHSIVLFFMWVFFGGWGFFWGGGVVEEREGQGRSDKQQLMHLLVFIIHSFMNQFTTFMDFS